MQDVAIPFAFSQMNRKVFFLYGVTASDVLEVKLTVGRLWSYSIESVPYKWANG